MKKALVLYTSKTGNTESFVDFLEDNYSLEAEMDAVLFQSLNITGQKLDLNSYDNIILGCYTWGGGIIPKYFKDYIIENREVLQDKNILLFGSGITIYKNFCGALDNIEIILDKQLPKIKFEITFEPNENQENIQTLERYIREMK